MKSAAMKVGVFLLALGLLAGCATTAQKGPTDQEQISSALTAWKAALQAKDIDKLMTLYSEKYMAEGRSKAQTKEQVKGFFDGGYLDKATFSTDATKITVEGDKATATPVTLSGAEGSIDLRLDFAKEDGKWMIIGSGQA